MPREKEDYRANLDGDKILCSGQREKHKMGPVSNSEEVVSAIRRGLDEASHDIASKLQGNSSRQSS